MPMPVSPGALFQERGVWRGTASERPRRPRGVSAHRGGGAKMFRRHFNFSGRRPQEQEGHPRSPAGPVRRREELEETGDSVVLSVRPPSLGVRARELRSQGAFSVPTVPPPSSPLRRPASLRQRVLQRSRRAGPPVGEPHRGWSRSVRWGHETVGSATPRQR